MEHKGWKTSVILSKASIRDALQIMDKSALQIVFVVDKEKRLLGVVTDGDVRRSILRGEELSMPVAQIMNYHPNTAQKEMGRAHV